MSLEHLKTMTDNSRKVHSGQTLKLKHAVVQIKLLELVQEQ